MGWCWVLREVEWDFASTWDQPELTLCGRPSPGPICPKYGSKLQCRVDGAGVLPQGSKLLCTPLRGLSMEICISVVPPGMCCNKAHHKWTHSHSAESAATGLKARPTPSHAPANELLSSAWTPQTLWALSTQLYQVLSRGQPPRI